MQLDILDWTKRRQSGTTVGQSYAIEGQSYAIERQKSYNRQIKDKVGSQQTKWNNFRQSGTAVGQQWDSSGTAVGQQWDRSGTKLSHREETKLDNFQTKLKQSKTKCRFVK